jgi:hypothetical protein
MIKLRYTNFWPGLDPNNFFITKYFENVMINNDNNNNDYDVLVSSVFPSVDQNLNINPRAKVILFNGEHPSYIINTLVRTGLRPDILMGFTDIPQNILRDLYKDKNLPLILYYPLWILYYDKLFSQEYFDKKNNELTQITKKDIMKKKLCTLINSHDMNNSRTPIYNYINSLSETVDCPGKLLNNMDRRFVGTSSEDKINFMNNYKFNICSENKYGHGYFTEKLPQCMDALCIPIYVGCNDFNKLNYKIFNKDRIIFLNNDTKEGYDVIKKLINSPDELYNLYKKPIFVENSYNYLFNYMEMTKKILIINL